MVISGRVTALRIVVTVKISEAVLGFLSRFTANIVHMVAAGQAAAMVTVIRTMAGGFSIHVAKNPATGRIMSLHSET